MDRAQIKEVLRDVFGRNLQMNDLGEWVSIPCPLAPWTHEKGRDGSPSAGVSVNDNGSSGFNCFTCKNPGPFSGMLRKYADFSGEDLDDLIDEIEEGEFLGPRHIPTYEEILAGRADEVAMPINEGIFMDLYDSAAGHPYLKKRGISDTTARKLELLYDPKDSEGDPRILFPVRGPDGLLYGFSGRATQEKARLKVRDYHGLAKSQCVLGSHLAPDARRIVTVEGLVDYAMVHEMGECGCAVMHSTMTEAQAGIILEVNKPTFLMYDNDKAGRDGTVTAIHRLKGYIPLFRTTYPKIQIEDTSEQGWHWLKDPGEMLQEELAEMLRKGELL